MVKEIKSFNYTFGLIFLMIGISVSAQNNEELGNVKWLRNYNEALRISAQSKKPIFILFQEVPGCSTCRNFGNEVLKNPLIVEAIETYFTPLAIFNNKSGQDAEILKKYNEPAWNNPVCLIVDKSGSELLPRLSNHYSEGSVVRYIRKGIDASNQLVPKYIQIIEQEYNAIKKELVLEMHCFWTGEKHVAEIPGVVSTMPGFSNGKEVVKVEFDASLTDEKKIITAAKKSNIAEAVHVNESGKKIFKDQNIVVKNLQKFTPDKDIHYYLKNSDYTNVPMSKAQASRANSLLGQGLEATIILSPRQIDQYHTTKNKKKSLVYLSLK